MGSFVTNAARFSALYDIVDAPDNYRRLLDRASQLADVCDPNTDAKKLSESIIKLFPWLQYYLAEKGLIKRSDTSVVGFRTEQGNFISHGYEASYAYATPGPLDYFADWLRIRPMKVPPEMLIRKEEIPHLIAIVISDAQKVRETAIDHNLFGSKEDEAMTALNNKISEHGIKLPDIATLSMEQLRESLAFEPRMPKAEGRGGGGEFENCPF